MNSLISIAIIRDALKLNQAKAEEYLEDSPLCPGVVRKTIELIEEIERSAASNEEEPTVTSAPAVEAAPEEVKVEPAEEVTDVEESTEAPKKSGRGFFG